MIKLNAEGFWEFSLAFYCKPQVASSLLSLQDRRDADVNMLLVVCWLATLGYQLPTSGLIEIDAAVQPWRDKVIKPLREVRRRIKGDFTEEISPLDQKTLHHTLLGAELDCERTGQRQIVLAAEVHCGRLQGKPAAELALPLMRAYLDLLPRQTLSNESDPQDESDLSAILSSL
ncbi:MAG TPA: TIGR02444 family protein [Dongiaceae bacterium]